MTYKAGDKCPRDGCNGTLCNDRDFEETRLWCTQCSHTFNENPPLAVKVGNGNVGCRAYKNHDLKSTSHQVNRYLFTNGRGKREG